MWIWFLQRFAGKFAEHVCVPDFYVIKKEKYMRQTFQLTLLAQCIDYVFCFSNAMCLDMCYHLCVNLYMIMPKFPYYITWPSIVTGIRAHISRWGGYITVGVQSAYQNSLDLFSALDSFIAGWKPETTVTKTKEPETLSRLLIVRNQGEARKAVNSCPGRKHTLPLKFLKKRGFYIRQACFRC